MASTPKTGEAKVRKTPKFKPIFVALQIMDENGQPMPISKDRIKLIAATKDASEILDKLESGSYPHATYKKVDLHAK